MEMYLIRIKGTKLCYGRGTLHRKPTGYTLSKAKELLKKLQKKGQVSQVFKKKAPEIHPASELELVPVHVYGKVVVEIKEDSDDK